MLVGPPFLKPPKKGGKFLGRGLGVLFVFSGIKGSWGFAIFPLLWEVGWWFGINPGGVWVEKWGNFGDFGEKKIRWDFEGGVFFRGDPLIRFPFWGGVFAWGGWVGNSQS